MYSIRTYTQTDCELEIAKSRLKFLKDKKDKLWTKYFPVTSKLKEVVTDKKSSKASSNDNNKIIDYLHELHDVDLGTGMSLAEEITYQEKNIENLKNYLNVMSENLSKLDGIKYRLYYEIVVNGMNISKAVEKVANTNSDVDVRTIWRNYDEIKNEIKNLKRFKCQ